MNEDEHQNVGRELVVVVLLEVENLHNRKVRRNDLFFLLFILLLLSLLCIT
jgi:hypothetical protein